MARNLSTKSSDVARSQYESRIIMNCNNNPKTFWSYVKKTNKPGDVSTLEDNHGQLITSSITNNRHMILEAIDKLNVSKAPGPDGIHARIIKECKESFSTVFHVILKKSLNEGRLPKQLKQANAKALFKKWKTNPML